METKKNNCQVRNKIKGDEQENKLPGGSDSDKKNLMFREMLLYFLLIDIVFYLVLGITDCDILEYKFIQYAETYSEKNPDSHILDWTFFLIAECVFCVVASGRLENICILSSLLLFIWIFVIYRYILLYKRGYQCSEQEMQGRFILAEVIMT